MSYISLSICFYSFEVLFFLTGVSATEDSISGWVSAVFLYDNIMWLCKLDVDLEIPGDILIGFHFFVNLGVFCYAYADIVSIFAIHERHHDVHSFSVLVGRKVLFGVWGI